MTMQTRTSRLVLQSFFSPSFIRTRNGHSRPSAFFFLASNFLASTSANFAARNMRINFETINHNSDGGRIPNTTESSCLPVLQLLPVNPRTKIQNGEHNYDLGVWRAFSPKQNILQLNFAELRKDFFSRHVCVRLFWPSPEHGELRQCECKPNCVKLPFAYDVPLVYGIVSRSMFHSMCNVCFRLAVPSFNPAHEWIAEDAPEWEWERISERSKCSDECVCSVTVRSNN